MKLKPEHIHILKLIARDRDKEGWASVSEKLFCMLSETIPSELATFERLDSGGRAKLTDEGQNVINALLWL